MQITEIITFVAMILVAGWFSAFITQLLKQVNWPSSAKLILSAIVAGAVALATAWLSGDVLGFMAIYAAGNLTAQELMVYFSGVFTSGAAWWRFTMRDAAWAQSLALWPAEKKNQGAGEDGAGVHREPAGA